MQTIDQIRHANFMALFASLGGSGRAMADRIGISAAQVSQIKNQSRHSITGRPRVIGDDLARKIEKAFGLPTGAMDTPSDAAPGTRAHQLTVVTSDRPTANDDEDRVVRVPMLAATASMGPGADQHDEDVITGTLSVSADWAARELHLPAARLKGLRFITGYGDSMRPTFASGDVLLVDTAVHEANVDGIYVLSSAQQLFIKRVTRRLDGVHEISSDNPAVRQTSVLNGDHRVDVLGRVVYVWNGRKV